MTNPPFDVVVHGLIGIDYSLQLDAAPLPGLVCEIGAETRAAGGPAVQWALALATWGAGVYLLGNSLGDDSNGRLARRQLEAVPNLTLLAPTLATFETPYRVLLTVPTPATATAPPPAPAVAPAVATATAAASSAASSLMPVLGRAPCTLARLPAEESWFDELEMSTPPQVRLALCDAFWPRSRHRLQAYCAARDIRCLDPDDEAHKNSTVAVAGGVAAPLQGACLAWGALCGWSEKETLRFAALANELHSVEGGKVPALARIAARSDAAGAG